MYEIGQVSWQTLRDFNAGDFLWNALGNSMVGGEGSRENNALHVLKSMPFAFKGTVQTVYPLIHSCSIGQNYFCSHTNFKETEKYSFYARGMS